MIFFISLFGVILIFICFCIFFDQAILNRRDTIYRGCSKKKKIVLTFDDGPSPEWTPLILDELKKSNIKAVFFMIGHHVQKYPLIAKRVSDEGHTIGNHGYAHSVMLYYTPAEIEQEIRYTEHVIEEVTGQKTTLFRPPKAWLRKGIKQKVKQMGYQILLWSLNSKDWVKFNHRYIVSFIEKRIKNGDILLFHDSGNIFTREGGDRTQTVKAISLLATTLRAKGYEFVGIDELLNEKESLTQELVH